MIAISLAVNVGCAVAPSLAEPTPVRTAQAAPATSAKAMRDAARFATTRARRAAARRAGRNGEIMPGLPRPGGDATPASAFVFDLVGTGLAALGRVSAR